MRLHDMSHDVAGIRSPDRRVDDSAWQRVPRPGPAEPGSTPAHAGVIRAMFRVLHRTEPSRWQLSEPLAELRRTPAYTLEVASRAPQHARGLSDRISLPVRHGMLFVFSEMTRPSFWMRNTFIDLDLAFMDATGAVVEVKSLKAHDATQVTASSPVKYAIEVAAGTFARDGVGVGAEFVALE